VARLISIIQALALRAASWVVPAAEREEWLASWSKESGHYAARLRMRGVEGFDFLARIGQRMGQAFAEAWSLRRESGSSMVLAGAGRPALFIVAPAAALAAIGLWSGGFSRTREMLEARGDLMLVAENGVMTGARMPVPAKLVAMWQEKNETFVSMAGYLWDGNTLWHGAGFEGLVPPGAALLLRRGMERRPLPRRDTRPLMVVGRLKPGVTVQQAVEDLRWVAGFYRKFGKVYPFPEGSVTPMRQVVREPLVRYAWIGGVAIGLLGVIGVAGILRHLRSRRFHRRYWLYFAGKAVLYPVLLCLAVWELSPAAAFTMTGTPPYGAEPWTSWVSVVLLALFIYWTVADQRARCRQCLGRLELPVRVGSPGAVLLDHAGVETVCCQGHGALYDPEMTSGHVQAAGWTALDLADDRDPHEVR